MVNIGSFWGQNDATGQNLGKAVKNFFHYISLKIISVRFMDINLVKNVIKGINLVKKVIFGRRIWKDSTRSTCFILISLTRD